MRSQSSMAWTEVTFDSAYECYVTNSTPILHIQDWMCRIGVEFVTCYVACLSLLFRNLLPHCIGFNSSLAVEHGEFLSKGLSIYQLTWMHEHHVSLECEWSCHLNPAQRTLPRLLTWNFVDICNILHALLYNQSHRVSSVRRVRIECQHGHSMTLNGHSTNAWQLVGVVVYIVCRVSDHISLEKQVDNRIGSVCLSICLCSPGWTVWPLTLIFGMGLDLDLD